MATDDSANYNGVLLEEANAKLDRLAEALADVPVQVSHMREDVAQLKADMQVVRLAVSDQSEQLAQHEERISALAQQVQA